MVKFIAPVLPENKLFGQQHFLATSNFVNNVSKSINKAYSGNITIGYVESQYLHYFTYLDLSMTITTADIPTKYEVRDMEVYGDNVYFCGKDLYQQCGFVGWFNIANMFFGAKQYHIYSANDLTPAHKILEFDKIEMTSSMHERRISFGLIGKNGDTIDCVAEFSNPSGSSTSWNYTLGYTGNLYERFHEICVTDNYVATIGSYMGHCDGLCVRVYNKSGMFPFGGPQNIVYKFTHTPSGLETDYIEHPKGHVEATHTINDKIAVACQMHYDQDGSGSVSGIIVNVFDVRRLLSLTNIYTSNSIVLPFSLLTDSNTVRDVCYNAPNSEILLLMQHYGLRNERGYIGEIPLPLSSSTLQFHYLENIEFNSIDNANAESEMFVSGHDGNLVDYYKQPIRTTSLCAENSELGYMCTRFYSTGCEMGFTTIAKNITMQSLEAVCGSKYLIDNCNH